MVTKKDLLSVLVDRNLSGGLKTRRKERTDARKYIDLARLVIEGPERDQP